MSLPNTILFPQALLPLYIFEPRYRLMLNEILEEDRMFAIALCDDGHQPRAIGGIGLVRACVHNQDGTANLVLQGVSRVRFTRFISGHPYGMADIECLPTTNGSTEDLEKIANQILQIMKRTVAKNQQIPNWMVRFLDELKDFEILADLVAYTFIEDTQTKQTILEELNLQKRLIQVREALSGQTNYSE